MLKGTGGRCVQVAAMVHWAACLYHFLAYISNFADDTWVVRVDIQDRDRLYR